ncbi:MAG: helix-turn-helix transcriptional regulator [Bacteroidaceae bacterium]|jgi:putative transcriptional regulator|nr:helix-turn-helix transcriptional regulator [Bacteroidaceae bacterium]MBO6079204.1 helix-turn-helix transcriptional regulator [Bacteroidaceae bacterium]
MTNTIRVERAIRRISQQDLANAIGVSRQTIFAIENEKFIPSTELALKLSAYFGKTVNELFQL